MRIHKQYYVSFLQIRYENIATRHIHTKKRGRQREREKAECKAFQFDGRKKQAQCKSEQREKDMLNRSIFSVVAKNNTEKSMT